MGWLAREALSPGAVVNVLCFLGGSSSAGRYAIGEQLTELQLRWVVGARLDGGGVVVGLAALVERRVLPGEPALRGRGRRDAAGRVGPVDAVGRVPRRDDPPLEAPGVVAVLAAETGLPALPKVGVILEHDCTPRWDWQWDCNCTAVM